MSGWFVGSSAPEPPEPGLSASSLADGGADAGVLPVVGSVRSVELAGSVPSVVAV